MGWNTGYDPPPSHEYERIDAVAECYRFVQGAQIWRYTSAEANITANIGDGAPSIYQSIAIERGTIAFSPEDGRRPLEINLPRDAGIAADFIALPDTAAISVAVHRKFENGGYWSPIWTGRVLQASFQGNYVHLRCEPPSVSLKRIALRRLYSRNCPHVLYGPECKVVAAPVTATVTSISTTGSSLGTDNSSIGADYKGGWFSTASGDVHMIESATNGSITALYRASLQIGEVLTCYKGCDHSLQTCDTRFANSLNFGGFPWMPRKNPFNNNVF